MAPVSEKVDERILRLLGLEFVFDLDYGTYTTLLNEAIVSGRNRLPQEELALLSNEKKRVRGKQGRFKPQKQKITADKFATTKFLKPVVQPISSPLLPAQVQAPPQQNVNLSPLQEPLESIKNTLQQFLKFRKSSNEQERRSYEASRRAKREAVLENVQKGMSAVSNAVKTFISPFQSIVDRIWRFVFFTLLGRTFNQLINWFSDPNNTKKVQTLQRFFKDWWPTLLGAAVLFFTPFGRFVRGILRIVGGLTGKLVGLIPKLGGAVNALRMIALRNPLLATLTVGTAGVAAAVTYFNNQQSKEEESQEVVGAQQQVQQFSSGGSILKSLFGFNSVNPYTQMFGYGGITSNTGQRISGFGPDTQLIAAQPGEIVINKRTVDAVGADTLLNMNRYYGGSGANQPKMGRLFNTGGMVGGNKPSLVNSKAVYIYNKLVSRGLSPTAAAGIVANIGVETGYTYSPSITQQGGGPGRGLAQWESGGRFDTDKINLVDFAKSRKSNWNSLGTQIDFIVHELNNHPEFIPLKSDLNKSKNVQEATQLFLTRYEKAGVSHLDRRLEVGKQLQEKLKVKSATKPSPQENKKEKQGRPWYDPFGWFGGAAAVQKKQGGGIFDVTENTGLKIPPSSFFGVDSQFVPLALQPGEKGFILPKNAVDNGAVPAFENLLANIDPTSNPAKGLDYRADPKIPEIKPLNKGGNQVTYLPDINQSSSGPSMSGGSGGGSQVPPFSAVSPKSARSVQVSIYDIKGV